MQEWKHNLWLNLKRVLQRLNLNAFWCFFFDSCVLVFKWYVERINNPCKVLCGGGWVLWNPRTILKDILRGGWTVDKILRKFVWQFKKWHMRDCCNTGWFWEKKNWGLLRKDTWERRVYYELICTKFEGLFEKYMGVAWSWPSAWPI